MFVGMRDIPVNSYKSFQRFKNFPGVLKTLL